MEWKCFCRVKFYSKSPLYRLKSLCNCHTAWITRTLLVQNRGPGRIRILCHLYHCFRSIDVFVLSYSGKGEEFCPDFHDLQLQFPCSSSYCRYTVKPRMNNDWDHSTERICGYVQIVPSDKDHIGGRSSVSLATMMRAIESTRDAFPDLTRFLAVSVAAIEHLGDLVS